MLGKIIGSINWIYIIIVTIGISIFTIIIFIVIKLTKKENIYTKIEKILK